MKLDLPSVTLIMIETRCHELAKLAIEDSIELVNFAEVLIFTDKPELIKIPGAKYVTVEDWPDKLGWAKCYWHDVPPHIKTSHTLMIQWDSWVYDPNMWVPWYLNHDYVGAPWWNYGDMNVGNSGFSLRSRRLMDHLLLNKDKYPVTTSAEDALLSRDYRPQLEQAGFVWPDDELALDFSFECVRRSKRSKHFGFHALRNWPAVLSEDKLAERLKLAAANPHITKGGMLGQIGIGPPFYILDINTDGSWVLATEVKNA